jgi:hypothetical protein
MMSNMHHGTLYPTNKNPGAPAYATRTNFFFLMIFMFLRNLAILGEQEGKG